jgi:orotate phosphoribosyltransferase
LPAEHPQAIKSALVMLLRERSVQTGSFTLASGRLSGFYIDARRTTMSARGLELVGKLGLAMVRDAGWDAAYVGGLTLGADPVAYAIARASLEHPPTLDAFTVRKAPKAHGMSRLIEGCFAPGKGVVVVEDVITTGASACRAIDAVRAAGGRVSGVLTVVDRGEGGRAAIEAQSVEVIGLVTLQDLGITPDTGDALTM